LLDFRRVSMPAHAAPDLDATRPPAAAAPPAVARGRRRVPVAAALLVAALAAAFVYSMWQPITTSNGASNLATFQAQAFLRGRLAIDTPLFDSVTVHGRFYVPFPPVPAVLMMPLVAWRGVAGGNGPLLAAILTLFNVIVAYRLAGRLGLTPRERVWLLLAFFLGTGYWLAARWSSGIWFWAHVVAVTFLLLAVAEAWGRGRGYLVGLALSAAFLSRQFTLLAALALAARLWTHPRLAAPAARRRNLAGFAATLGLGVIVYLALNQARFGNPFDTGYGYYRSIDVLAARISRHGTFSAAYVPFNLIYLLLQGFHVDFNSPTKLSGVVTDAFGTSLPGASPFILVALFARRSQAPVRALWASIIAIAVGQLFYFNNGWVQQNTQRFTLDFLPLLFVLVAAGMTREIDAGRARLWRGCIVYAVLLNTVFLTFLPVLEAALRVLDR
jgi:hypothetical protein